MTYFRNLPPFKGVGLVSQLKQHAVALLSLITAITGFVYNTWQSHENEINQNMRIASFEVLKNLGELQSVVNYAHYELDKVKGNAIDGWKYTLMIKDLSHLLNPSAAKAGQDLYQIWQLRWETLDTDANSELLISEQISKTRQTVIKTIDELE